AHGMGGRRQGSSDAGRAGGRARPPGPGRGGCPPAAARPSRGVRRRRCGHDRGPTRGLGPDHSRRARPRAAGRREHRRGPGRSPPAHDRVRPARNAGLAGREARGRRGDGATVLRLSGVAVLECPAPLQAGRIPQAGPGRARLGSGPLVPARLGDHAPAAALSRLHARPRAASAGRRVTLAVGVLASGRGSNLQAILDACARPAFPARVVVVISDRERSLALERARTAGVEALWMNPKDFTDRETFDLALVRELQARQVGLVCQAGYMRILSPVYIRAFAGRSLNIHPSLLPAFPGLHAQRQALERGVKGAGAPVPFADQGVDSGPIVLQAAVPVAPDDTEETLSARILAEEHRIYPEAIRLFAEGRLRIVGRK